MMYENDCIQWVLILFLVIFNASLSGSDDFVLFDSLHGNCIHKCDIPILRTNLQLLMEIQLLSTTYAFWMVKDKIGENKEKFQ